MDPLDLKRYRRAAIAEIEQQLHLNGAASATAGTGYEQRSDRSQRSPVPARNATTPNAASATTPNGAEKLIFADAQLDTLIRTIKGLPPRPLERLPYEGLFQLEPIEVAGATAGTGYEQRSDRSQRSPVPARNATSNNEVPEVLLLGFTGDLAWIHAREGHAGRPYWPGGQSGLTLDPGFDLGYQNAESLRRYYGFLSEPQRAALIDCMGVRGHSASGLPKRLIVRDIRVSTEQANALMPLIAKPYWDGITARFPALVTAPGAVQTVLLSLAFNRGKNNRDLEVLRKPLERGDHHEVARLVSAMQQNHELRGVSKRRRLEGELITQALQSETDERLA